MSDTTIVTTLVSSGGTLLVSVVTLITNAFIERFRAKLEIQKKESQSKIEHLDDIYKELISIINLYPDVSPNDILEYVDYAPI